MGTPQAVIATDALTKHYGNVEALVDLTLDVRPGEIFGFLGPNGAGKSTAIRLLLGFLHPTAGRASILGFDAVRDSVEIRRRVGYLPGGIAFWDNLSGERLLDELSDLSGHVADLAGQEHEAVGLDDLGEWVAAGWDARQGRDGLGHGSCPPRCDGPSTVAG